MPARRVVVEWLTDSKLLAFVPDGALTQADADQVARLDGVANVKFFPGKQLSPPGGPGIEITILKRATTSQDFERWPALVKRQLGAS